MILLETEMPEVTFGALDNHLLKFFGDGRDCTRMVLGTEVQTRLRHMAEEAGAIIAAGQTRRRGELCLVSAFCLSAYVHPITGAEIPIAGEAGLGRHTVRFEREE